MAKHTIPAILARSRDTDTVMRRLVYSAVLGKNCTTEDGAMGPLHPRVLAQRELIIRNGLGDREPAVRAAAGSLLGVWVEVVRGSTKEEEDSGGLMDNVVALLALFDLQDNTVAEDALLSIFTTRVDIFDQLEFKGAYMRPAMVIHQTHLAHKTLTRPVLGHVEPRKSLLGARIRGALHGYRRPDKVGDVPPRRDQPCVPHPRRV